MGTAEIVWVRMREDELLARLRYHEDRQREAERRAAFHRAAGEAARNDLAGLQRPAGRKPSSSTPDGTQGGAESAPDDSWNDRQSPIAA
jgi:hypothetical protein